MIPCLSFGAAGAAATHQPADDAHRLEATLARWGARGWLRPLDAAFAGFLWREVADAHPLLILAAALASHQLGRGHVCLDLVAALADPQGALGLPPEGSGPAGYANLSDAAADDAGLGNAGFGEDWPGQDTPRGDGLYQEVGSALQIGAACLSAQATRVDGPHPLEPLRGVSLEAWLAALDSPVLVGSGAGATPLVRAGTRLYLRRFWEYEQAVREGIRARLERATDAALSDAALQSVLAALFPTTGEGLDWQQCACALAARSAFSIITGGPGTGKTTTVVRLLAALQALALQAAPGVASEGVTASSSLQASASAVSASAPSAGVVPRPLRIRLAAPTGKAAARLSASIAGAVATLPLEGLAEGERVRAAIPTRVTTLHRLLGSRPDSRHFRHHAGHPLALDVLVIDEASMVDLEMMAAVLAALPVSARLVLLGDKDQLASVEAGAVLGALCARAAEAHYTPATAAWLARVCARSVADAWSDVEGTTLDQSITMLRHSHRFSAASGIGRLARAVNDGAADEALGLLRAGAADLCAVPLGDAAEARLRALALHGRVAESVVESGLEATADVPGEGLNGQENGDDAGGFLAYLEVMHATAPVPAAGLVDDAALDAWAARVLAAHARFQWLCALRRGPWGVDGLNQRVAQALHAAGRIPRVDGWYPGRPVLVTRNDHALGLMNGDIGVTLLVPGAGEAAPRLRVAFPRMDGELGVRWVLPSRLRAVETVYALTVHKSQGSEFDHAVLILPERMNPVLTRELLYTGITRARRRLTLVNAGDERLIAETVVRRVLRAGGLTPL